MSWNLFLLFKYSGWIFLLLLLLLLLPGIWFNIIKVVKRIPRISISLVLIYYHVLEVGTARANVESELKDSAVSQYSSFLHCLKTYFWCWITGIWKLRWYRLLAEILFQKKDSQEVSAFWRYLRCCSVCPKMIISFLHLLLGQVWKQKKVETFTVAYAEIHWTVSASR